MPHADCCLIKICIENAIFTIGVAHLLFTKGNTCRLRGGKSGDDESLGRRLSTLVWSGPREGERENAGDLEISGGIHKSASALACSRPLLLYFIYLPSEFFQRPDKTGGQSTRCTYEEEGEIFRSSSSS